MQKKTAKSWGPVHLPSPHLTRNLYIRQLEFVHPQAILSSQHLLLQLPGLVAIVSVIVAFNLSDKFFHLLALSLPFLLAHFGLSTEQLLVRLPIASAQAIPERCILTIVEVKVEMMHGMACGAVYDRTVGYVFSVVDHDGPDVDEREQANIRQFLQGEYEWEDVVWYALGKAIKWVESVARKRCRHDPFVMRLMKCFVDLWVMEATVDPVYQEVGEEEEEGELEVVVQWEGCLSGGIVKLPITAYLSCEDWVGQDSHEGHGEQCLFHLKGHLVLEVFRVLKGVVIEYEEI